MVNEDYDYYKNFYSYAYNPPSDKGEGPYGYTPEQWAEAQARVGAEAEEGKPGEAGKYKAFQEDYLEENPEMAQKIDPNFKPRNKKGCGKKESSGGKGFWFHGI